MPIIAGVVALGLVWGSLAVLGWQAPSGIVAQGLVQGSIAAFDALGLVLLYRTTRVVNLAQPSMGLIGGVISGLLVTIGGWSFWWAAPVGLATGGVVGLATDRIILRRLQDVPRAVVLVATVGLAQLLGGIAVALSFAIAGGPVRTFSIDLGVTVSSFPPVRLLGPHLLVLIVMPLAWLGTYLFLHRSRFGLAALALGQEVERARALGVPAAAVRGVVWAVAGMLAALGSILSIPILGFNIGGGLGPVVLLLALAPAVLAGFRSLHVAVLGALGLGVAYEIAIHNVRSAGHSVLLLGLAVVGAIAVGRRRLGRAEAAARASSWEAAATPRPLSRALLGDPVVRLAAGALLVAAIVGAALPPALLGPDGDVGYATAAAFALAALGVAVGWMFAGELSLGHWGFAALGGVLAAITPGPWPLRCLVSAAALTAVGAVLAVVSRRRSALTFAVLSLAFAATAPVAVQALGRRVLAVDADVGGATTAVICVLTAAAVLWLRRTVLGGRLVAARDDPQRAPWLGADPVRMRVIGLSISVGIAGLAGGLYYAVSPIGLTSGGVEASRSLELLGMTVIGGLGSPAGALLGAAVIRAGQIMLQGTTWAAFLSGAGILVVVLYAPAGISRMLGRARDLIVRWLAPSGHAAVPPDRREAA